MEFKKNKITPPASPSMRHRLYQALVDEAAALVDTHDKAQAAVDRFFGALLYSLVYEYNDARNRYRGNWRRMMAGFFGLIVVICVELLVFDHYTVYQYAYNGRPLGYVSDQQNVYDILDIAGDELSKNNDANIRFKANENVTFRMVSRANKDIDGADQVLDKLTYMTEIEVLGYGIYEDDELKAVLESEKEANEVLDRVKRHYQTPDSGMVIDEVKFENPVEVKTVNVMLTSVQTEQEAETLLEKGGDIQIHHIVMEDETPSTLRRTYSMAPQNIVDRENVGTASVSAGDEVLMTRTIAPLNVRMTESGTMKEVIHYHTVYKKTNDLYKGDKEIKQKGVNGSRLITGTIVFRNGKEIKRDIDKEEVLKKSVDRIELIGTNNKPKWYPTGHFKFPVSNPVITSYFGPRWGTVHQGIDFSASTGTPIHASDGGTVIRAENYGGYGLCVDVEHKDGTFTRYGHNSQLLVKAGDKVAQGQKIALAGSTGHSTGAHCHFEIHPHGGDAVDPYPYLYGSNSGNHENNE